MQYAESKYQGDVLEDMDRAVEEGVPEVVRNCLNMALTLVWEKTEKAGSKGSENSSKAAVAVR